MDSTLNKEKYIELLADTIPTVIKDDCEYRRLESKAHALKTLGEDLTVEQVAVLQLILALMQHYENNNLSRLSSNSIPSPPNEVLRELMNIRGLKQKDLIPFFHGHKGNVSAVLNGKRTISIEQAKALADYFSVSHALFV